MSHLAVTYLTTLITPSVQIFRTRCSAIFISAGVAGDSMGVDKTSPIVIFDGEFNIWT